MANSVSKGKIDKWLKILVHQVNVILLDKKSHAKSSQVSLQKKKKETISSLRVGDRAKVERKSQEKSFPATW